MAAPAITSAPWITAAMGLPAVMPVTTEVPTYSYLQLSFDGGATWLGGYGETFTLTGYAPLGMTVEISAPEGDDVVEVTFSDASSAGEFPIWLRTFNDESFEGSLAGAGPGPVIEGRVTVLGTELLAAGVTIELPKWFSTRRTSGAETGVIRASIWPTSDGGFVVVGAGDQAPPTSTVDFGNGVVQSVVDRGSAVICVYDRFTVAQRSVAIRGGSNVDQHSVQGADVVDGRLIVYTAGTAAPTQWWRNDHGSWQTTTAGNVWCFNLADLSLAWTGTVAGNAPGASIAGVLDGRVFITGGGTWSATGAPAHGFSSGGNGGMWQIRVSDGAAEAVFWATEHSASGTSVDGTRFTRIHNGSRGERLWMASSGFKLWRRTASGTTQVPLEKPPGSPTLTETYTSSKGADTLVCLTLTEVVTNLWTNDHVAADNSRKRSMLPRAVIHDDGEPTFSAQDYQPSNTWSVATLRWAGVDYNVDAGTRGHTFITTDDGGYPITMSDRFHDAYLSTNGAADTGSGGLIGVTAMNTHSMSEFTDAVPAAIIGDDVRSVMVHNLEDGDVVSTAAIVRAEWSGATHMELVGMAPQPGGVAAWVMWKATGAGLAQADFYPGGGHVEQTHDATVGAMWVTSITAAGEWQLDVTSDPEITPDPVAPVVPTDPYTDEFDNPVPEGSTWSASFESVDPNASIVDHPDPVAGFAILVWDSGTGAWRMAADGLEVPAWDGTLDVTNDGFGQCTVSINPHSDFDGAVTIRLQAVSVSESGVQSFSSIVTHVIDWLPEPDPPSDPEGEFPDTMEDTAVSAWFDSSDPDTGDSHTWYVSPNSDPEAAYSPASSSWVTLYDDSDPEKVAGVAQWTAGQGDLHARLTFTPAANYHGTTSGSVQVRDSIFESGWSSFSITVHPVIDDPGPITPTTFPDIIEDGFAVVRFQVSDPDLGDSGVTWEWEVSADGAYWTDDWADGVDLKVTIVDTEEASEETDDLWVDVRIEPRGNYNGPATFALRMTKTSPTDTDTDDVRVVTAWITGTILPEPDAPRAPQPSRMPTVEQGETAAQTFTTADPDTGDTATFEVRRVGGSWSTSTVSLGATTGDVFVDQGSTDDLASIVRFVPHPLFTGRYQFDIRVVDSFGLYSPATRVTGHVTTRGLSAELVEVQRTSGAAQLVSLGPVPMLDPELTESVNGPDGVSCRIEGRVLRHLAELWDRRDPVTNEVDAGEVVAPFGVELHVRADGQLQFAGPVSRRSFDRFADTYSIDQRGIGAYLERRELEDEAAEYTNEEQTEIIASLIDDAQAAPYGELLIDTSTVTNTSENRTVTFDEGTALSDCVRELQDQLDGCEVRITADRELLADLWLGVDRRNELVFTEAIISGLRDDEDADALTTVAHVDGDEVTGSSSAGTGVLGRFGRVTSRADADRVGTEEGADRAAARLITTRGNAAKTVRFTHHAAVDAPQGRGAWDYRAGDVCTLDVNTPAGRFFAHGRIATRSIRPAAGPAGGYDIDLDVELLAPDGVVRPLRGAHNPDMVEQLYDLYKRR